MPCTAKKLRQIGLKMNGAVDQVLTIREFGQLLTEKNINLAELSDDSFDELFDENSGAGRIFGATGGVMEAAVRTAYQLLTGKSLQQVEIKALRGNDAVKSASITIHGQQINVAVVNGIANVETILSNMSDYHFIEVMACPGGCAGGGGTPTVGGTVVARQNGMYAADRSSKTRLSHDNTDLRRIYQELGQPGDAKAKALLHVAYQV